MIFIESGKWTNCRYNVPNLSTGSNTLCNSFVASSGRIFSAWLTRSRLFRLSMSIAHRSYQFTITSLTMITTNPLREMFTFLSSCTQASQVLYLSSPTYFRVHQLHSTILLAVDIYDSVFETIVTTSLITATTGWYKYPGKRPVDCQKNWY